MIVDYSKNGALYCKRKKEIEDLENHGTTSIYDHINDQLKLVFLSEVL